MTVTTSVWSRASAQRPIEELRKAYPSYTDNELYAIWSHTSGLIPLDTNGRVDIETWQDAAREDGKHIQEGGFRVSRALYGRAKLARRGVAKPARKVRAFQPVEQVKPTGISEQALRFARTYDSAARVINNVVRKQREIHDLLIELRDIEPSVVDELAKLDPTAKSLLEQARSL